MSNLTNEELLGELGVDVVAEKKSALTPRQERIIAGFEDIQRFVEEHGRQPVNGQDRDIFERIYATRLDQIKRQKECVELLANLDHQKLLDGSDVPEGLPDDIDDEDILNVLGVELGPSGEGDITDLQHVKTRAEVRAAEEVANRKRCDDFARFKPIFLETQQDLKLDVRKTVPFKDEASVKQGDIFILSGQIVYVAEMGEMFQAGYGRPDSRLRVIYDNGTESDILMRSLQRALNKDENGRRVSDPVAGPLFKDEPSEGDQASGTIYICRSLSNDPYINEHRDIIHKIGVTSGSVETRIAAAETDPTYLFAKVKLVATYELYNINRNKLEKLLHMFFENARLDVRIQDRFGKPVSPREWFVVPLDCIEEAVERIKDGSIIDYKYDQGSAKLVKM